MRTSIETIANCRMAMMAWSKGCGNKLLAWPNYTPNYTPNALDLPLLVRPRNHHIPHPTTLSTLCITQHHRRAAMPAPPGHAPLGQSTIFPVSFPSFPDQAHQTNSHPKQIEREEGTYKSPIDIPTIQLPQHPLPCLIDDHGNADSKEEERRKIEKAEKPSRQAVHKTRQ